MLALHVTSCGTPEEKLRICFRMYDIDGNGMIDINEMKRYLISCNVNLSKSRDSDRSNLKVIKGMQICKGDARHVAIMQSSYQDKYDQLVWREFLLSWKWWRTSDISLTHLFYLLKPRLKLQLHKLKIIHFHTSNCDSVFRTLSAVYEVVGEPTDRDKAEQLFKKLDENCDPMIGCCKVFTPKLARL